MVGVPLADGQLDPAVAAGSMNKGLRIPSFAYDVAFASA